MEQWEVARVFRADLSQPHDKFCICIDWDRRWFFYFNSEPPAFRKARDVAVTVENFEALFLKHTSYVDTTAIIEDVPEDALQLAINSPERMHGLLSPTLIAKIKEAVAWHSVLTDEQRAVILA